jgi:hypothetical protein
MKGIILLAALALAGCAPKLQFANEAGGVVSQAMSPGNDRAFALAEAHCEKYGKVARIESQTALVKSTRFECVAR